MKLLIDIPEHIYEHAKESSEDSRDEFAAMRAIANGIQQESRSENPNTCGDAISRQAVLDEIDRRFDLAKPFKQLIESMPSVSPQQRTGRWIDAEVLDKIRAEIETDLSHFCFDEWGNENPTWKEIKAIIDKYKAESEVSE